MQLTVRVALEVNTLHSSLGVGSNALSYKIRLLGDLIYKYCTLP